jgi:hypothetical protein
MKKVMNLTRRNFWGSRLTAVVLVGLVAQSAAAAGIVSRVSNAPVVPDGTVAGAVTDFVIDLDRSLDPEVEGRTLLAGKTIKITLPDEFVNTGTPAIADVFSSASCVPNNLQCTTGVLLQGWPQHPIVPRFPPSPPGVGAPVYSLSLEGTNTIVFTADVDVVPGLVLPGPGIKQIHLILNGFINPRRPGPYPIKVEAETGPNGELETGEEEVWILPRVRPHIGVTSAFNPGAPNTIYQEASPGEITPLPYDFLLWDRKGEPFENVTIEMVSRRRALLRQGDKVVGRIKMKAPRGERGHTIVDTGPSFAISAPVTAVPTARLTALFEAGFSPGDYVVDVCLNGGTCVRMFVNVAE